MQSRVVERGAGVRETDKCCGNSQRLGSEGLSCGNDEREQTKGRCEVLEGRLGEPRCLVNGRGDGNWVYLGYDLGF